MARVPIATSKVSRVPTLGAGWHFPVVRENSPGHTAAPRANFVMAFDELSVRQSIEIILSTRKGERVMRPEFGCDLDRLLFAPNNAATQALAAFEVTEALRAWEPRIEVLDVSARAGGVNGEQLLIDIDYRVRSTDNRFNLVYPFYLTRALS
jgi:phage baseplate assembly protein W